MVFLIDQGNRIQNSGLFFFLDGMSGVRNDSYMLSSVCSTSQFVSVSIQCPFFSKRVYQCEVWFSCEHSEEVQQSRCTSETSGSLIEGSFLSYVLGV